MAGGVLSSGIPCEGRGPQRPHVVVPSESGGLATRMGSTVSCLGLAPSRRVPLKVVVSEGLPWEVCQRIKQRYADAGSCLRCPAAHAPFLPHQSSPACPRRASIPMSSSPLTMCVRKCTSTTHVHPARHFRSPSQRCKLNLRIDFTGRSEELLVILISVNRDRLEIDPRSEIRLTSTRDRSEIDYQIWSNSSSRLLVGRRSCFDPPTVTSM